MTLAVLVVVNASAADAAAGVGDMLWQPAEERQAQNVLPKGGNPLWNVLAATKVTYSDKAPHISMTQTSATLALSGTAVVLDGFMMPLDGGEYSSHFLLSRRTPTCFYCPPGEPNEVVEVMSSKPVKYGAEMLDVSGTLQLVNDTEQGIFYRISPAEVAVQGAAKGGWKDMLKPLW